MCIYSQLLVSKYVAIARSVQTDKKCRKSVRYPFSPAAQMLLNSLLRQKYKSGGEVRSPNKSVKHM